MFSRAMQRSSSIFEPQETRATASRLMAWRSSDSFCYCSSLSKRASERSTRDSSSSCVYRPAACTVGVRWSPRNLPYSYETVRTAFHVIQDFFGPALLIEPITDLDDLARRLSPFRGHNMAKAGLELAYMELLARMNQQSLSALIGGERERSGGR